MKKLLVALVLALVMITVFAVPVFADPPANYGSLVSGSAHVQPGQIADNAHWAQATLAAGDPYGWGSMGGAVEWVKDIYGVTVGIGQGQNK